MGGDSKDGAGAERVPTWGGEAAHWETGAEREGRGLELPLTRGGHEGGGIDGYPDVDNEKSEHMVAQYIATRPLLDLGEGERSREGAKVPLRWWDQAGIDWEKANAKGVETDMTDGT